MKFNFNPGEIGSKWQSVRESEAGFTLFTPKLMGMAKCLQPPLHIAVDRQLVEEVGEEGHGGVDGRAEEPERLDHEELIPAQPRHVLERVAPDPVLL